MPITFRCSDCTQKLRIEDSFAGKRVACVRCGSKQRVPLESSPEFSQPGARPRKRPKPAPPPPLQKDPKEPVEPEPVAPPPARRQSPKPAIPPAPIWFKSIGPAEGKLSPREPAPPEPQPELLPEPQLEAEPEVNADVLAEILADIQPEPAPFLELKPLPEPLPAEETHSQPTWAEQEAFDADRTLFMQAPEVQPEAEEFRQPDPEPAPRPMPAPAPMPAPRRRTAPAARAEPSLVPPYQKLDVEEMIDMTAMVDIVFFLLIFFLVTSMHSLDSTIPMPVPDPQKGAAREPKSVAAIDSDDSYVVVRIDRNDKILIEGSEVRNDRELLFKLNELRRASARPEKLLVVGHGDATHGTVVMVLDAGRELGMDQVRLTMQDEPE